MFHFTPLLGAHSTSPATQSLIELDNSIKILIDVGWDSTFNPQLLAALEHHTPTIDLILLTHPTLAHMGAYAHACKHIRGFSSIPVYATFPVSNLGQLMLMDMYLSSPLAYTPLLDKKEPGKQETTEFSAQGYLPTDSNAILELPSGALKLPPTTSEIEAYCTKIVTLKYSQPTALHSAVARVAGKLGSVTITAFEAGHSLGGTIWKIQQAQESIVYAVDWNLSRDNCLRGAGFLGGEGGRVQEQLARPTALVCSTKNASITNIAGGRKKRDELLMDTIKRVAVDNNGTVLIPTDSAGRVLELAYILEHAWRTDPKLADKNKGVGLYMAGRRVKRLSQVVGRMLEWMDESVVREFEGAIAEADAKYRQSNTRKKDRKDGRKDGNKDVDMDDVGKVDVGSKLGPFDFVHMNLVATPGQLARILNSNDGKGKVIIATDTCLEWGLCRDAIMNLAGNEKTVVIMTERGEGKTGLAGWIWQGWQEKMKTEEPGFMAGLEGEFEMEVHAKRPLENEERDSYERYIKAQQALTSQHQSLMSSTGLDGVSPEDENESDSESSDDDSDSERQGKALTAASSKKVSQATLMMGGGGPDEKVDQGVNILLRGENVYDYDVRGAKGRNRMFPFQTSRKRIDEYGEVVRPDDYMRAEERQEEEASEKVSSEQAVGVMGQKRKFNQELPPKPGAPAPTSGSKPTKQASLSKRLARRDRNQSADDSDDYDPDSIAPSEEDSSSSEDESSLITPSKLVTSHRRLVLRCSTTFIDFSGLHDQKSLRMLLPLIDPKKLILVAGKRDETKYLAEFYREKSALSSSRSRGGTSSDVFSPQAGIRVNASVDTNAWLVKLGSSLDRSIKWQNVRGLGVVHVLGRVTTPAAESGTSSPAPEAKKQKVTALGGGGKAGGGEGLVLDTLPPALAAATRSVAQPIHVGDIRLADLRRVLQGDGHTAEFRGEGTLLVDGVVVVRKTGVGSVSVEDGGMGFLAGDGGKGRSFMAVRRKVYDGLAVVAGG